MLSFSVKRVLLRAKSWTLVLLQISLLVLPGNLALANPLAPSVVAGSATIHQHGSTTHIHQATNQAIINWQGFSIASGEVTQFIQPSSNAAILNRVTGGNPSAILGSLQSNGRVFLINPNGIVFGQGAQINVGGLVASTLDVNNAEFMRGGDLNFRGSSSASVINHGQIRALDGDIYLIGARVENHGLLQASYGTVGLAAGQDVRLVDSGHKHLVVRPNANSLGGTGVLNTGTINAVQTELAANGGNVYALAINNKGTLRVKGAVFQDGEVYLTSNGGKIENSGDTIAKNRNESGGKVVVDSGIGGSTNVSGNVDVSGTTGGTVHLLGEKVLLAGATVNAFGTDGGGVVLVGGDYQGGNPAIANSQSVFIDSNAAINADATLLGDGGKVIVWSDDTTSFSGNITVRGGAYGGNGGLIEVSGKNTLIYDGHLTALAPAGENGNLLLDPGKVDIGGGSVTFTADEVKELWFNGNTTISTVADGEGGMTDDDITVFADLFPADVDDDASVPVASSNSLSLVAGRDVIFKDVVFNLGDGDITATAGRHVILDTVVAGDDVIVLSVGGAVTLLAGNDSATGGNVVLQGGSEASVSSFTGSTTVTAKSSDEGDFGSVILNGGAGNAQIGVSVLVLEEILEEVEFDELLFINSPISVTADGKVSLILDTDSGTTAQIGHGGFEAPAFIYAGDIDVMANRVELVVNEEESTAQIGHGGPFAGIFSFEGFDEFEGGLFLGDISVTTTGEDAHVTLDTDADVTTAQIGHGGPFASMLSVDLLDQDQLDSIAEFFDIEVEPVTKEVVSTALLTFLGRDNFDSNIDVMAAGKVLIHAGHGDSNFTTAQIGHGGFGAFGAVMGNVDVQAGDVIELKARGGFNTAQIGHGGVQMLTDFIDLDFDPELPEDPFGFFAVGDISVTADGNVLLRTTGAGDDSTSATQIGHGGISALGTASGMVTVESMAGVELRTDSRLDNAQIGHGGIGSGNEEEFEFELDIFFTAEGDIEVTSVDRMRLRAFDDEGNVQIGHGGYLSNLVSSDEMSPGVQGAITVNVNDGNLIASALSEMSTVQIGHGGFESVGSAMGDVDVTVSGDLNMLAGSVASTAQIGHGGYFSDSAEEGSGGFDAAGAVRVMAGGKVDLFVTPNDEDSFDSTVQIGHGGFRSVGSANGLVSLTAGDRVRLRAEGEDEPQNTVLIGHGGFEYDGDTMGSVSVVLESGNLRLDSRGELNTVQIGHGGYEAMLFGEDDMAGAMGDILVQLDDGRLVAEAREVRSTVQIGHGGYEAEGSADGKIDVIVSGNTNLLALEDYSTAQIGHGSHAGVDPEIGPFDAMGDISLIIGGRLTLESNGGEEPATTQVGHGGYSSIGDRSGNITVVVQGLGREEPSGHINLRAIGVAWDNAQIGHGGFESEGISTGDIEVTSVRGRVTLLAAGPEGSDGFDNTAQIGHGGHNGLGNLSGAIKVVSASNMRLSAVSDEGESENIAQIGHGGFNFGSEQEPTAMLSGNILVLSGDNLTLEADDFAMARIGHGSFTFPDGDPPLEEISLDIVGEVIVGFDQLDPTVDEGGRFFMNRNSRIQSGFDDDTETFDTLAIFGTRREGSAASGFVANEIEDGAIINGVAFDGGGTPGTINGVWTPNAEFTNWDHEQWGFILGGAPGPYTNPFTFYYLGEDGGFAAPAPGFDIGALQAFEGDTVYDRFERYILWANTIFDAFQGPAGSSSFLDSTPRPMGELTGESSSSIFGP